MVIRWDLLYAKQRLGIVFTLIFLHGILKGKKRRRLRKEYRKAAIEFEKALSKKPGEQDFAINLAKTYYILERYKDAEGVLTPFHKEENVKYDVYFYLGKSAQAREGFARAVLYFREAVSHFGVNIFLLNALGECYFNLKNIDEARAAWEKSLEISPDQPQIREKLSLIKGKK